ncbi:MAG: YeeE/YedE thiosulfate transporter family protein [Saprospiraceae bacterium]
MSTILAQSWSWWFSGFVIGSIMLLIIFFGQSFGFSSNLRTICSIAGAGNHANFFKFNWKTQIWNLMFLLGAIIGGWIAGEFMSDGKQLELSQATISDLNSLGFQAPSDLQPKELFSLEAILSLKVFGLLGFGGLLVGFGSRYAGGCTSGHAISGISNLQIPSIIAVVGFFLGGLFMTHILFPLLF